MSSQTLMVGGKQFASSLFLEMSVLATFFRKRYLPYDDFRPVEND